MYIKGFSIGFDKSKKLWLVILGAVTIAVLLIMLSFVLICQSGMNKGDIIESLDLSKIHSYKTKYSLNVKSNKNQNHYIIEEEYKKENESEYFQFKVFDVDDVITYTMENNTLNIVSSNQKLIYTLSDYMIKKENMISISTFLDLYRKGIEGENDLFCVTVNEYDNKVSYKIEIKEELPDEYDFLHGISGLELIVDQEKKMLEEYIVYDTNKNSYIDIIYEKFLINI
ncbi:MAG: hypothetical protein Q4D02_07340 [Clostridia bacterium]|nr:hypothetical protein [Clostridia bacterium]